MQELKENDRFDVSSNAMAELHANYDSGSADEAKTSTCITKTKVEAGELLCPHSAVGVHVGKIHLRRNPSTPMVSLATAHPAKFPDAVFEATGLEAPLPPHMGDLYDRPERVTRVANDLTALQAVIKGRITH